MPETRELVGIPIPGIPQRQNVVLVKLFADVRKAVAREGIERRSPPHALASRSWLPYFSRSHWQKRSARVAANGRTGLQRFHRAVEQDALLIDDLHEGNGRILGVGQPRVRVLVLQQVDHLADLDIFCTF